jgi:hypothetical protein
MPYQSMDSAPTGAHRFFLVRPCGEAPFGGKYLPSVVQQIDGELFSPENEIDPLVWIKRGTELETSGGDGTYQPATRVEDVDLEWRELPDHEGAE